MVFSETEEALLNQQKSLVAEIAKLSQAIVTKWNTAMQKASVSPWTVNVCAKWKKQWEIATLLFAPETFNCW